MRSRAIAGLVCAAWMLATTPARGQADSTSDSTPGDVVAPVLVQDAQAVYPPEALAEGRTATVVLVLDIDAEGRVVEAAVREPVGYGFDEAAREASLRLVFTPARRAGQNVASRIVYRSSFRLAPPPADPAPVDRPLPAPTLAGVVRLAEGDVPLAGATVRARLSDGRVVQATCDASGRWELPGMAQGMAAVTVSATGFEAASFEQQLGDGDRLEVVYRLRAASRPLEVRVRGDKPDREVTRRVLQRQELVALPGTGGDALRALQSMPGVARADPFAGLLVVRGSSPAGTAVFVDGTPLPVVYHFGGLSSTLPTEMIESIDFFPGNFSARYGRVQGGIVDVHLREIGRDGHSHGMGQIDLIDARLMLGGPVPLLDGWSFEAAGRRSHVDAWINGFLSDYGTVRKAPVYYDGQLVAETRPTPSSRLRVGVFGSDDRVSLLLDDAIPQDPGMGSSLAQRTSSVRGQVVYRSELSSRVRLSLAGAAGLDRDAIELGAIQADTRYRPVTLRGELEWKLGEALTLRAGPDLVFTRYSANVRTIPPPDPSAPDPGPLTARPLLALSTSGWLSMPAGYGELEWRAVEALTLLLGGRADYHSWTGRTDLSPRLNARYDLVPEFPRSTIKAGVGVFHEPPQPVETSDVFGTPSLRSSRALHASLGMEQQLGDSVDVSLEGFYKHLDDLVVGRAMADGSLGYDNAGQGRVLGAELLLRHRPARGFLGWVAYTFSRSTRIDGRGEPEHPFAYDQTHALTALGSLQLGRGWTVGARFRLVSGTPYTPCTGGIQNAATGTYACVRSAPFSRRLPTWHQLDLRGEKVWTFPDWRLTAYVDLLDAYDHDNPEAVEYNFNFTRSRYQDGLPIIPSLGLRGEF